MIFTTPQNWSSCGSERISHMLRVPSSIIRRSAGALARLEQLQGGDIASGTLRPDTTAFVLDECQYLNSQRSCSVLSSLFGHSYWERVWIFQEVAHARRATLLSGRHQADLADIAMASAFWVSASAVWFRQTGRVLQLFNGSNAFSDVP